MSAAGPQRTEDEVARLEELPEGTRLHGVHGARLQVHQDGPGHVLSGGALAVGHQRSQGARETGEHMGWGPSKQYQDKWTRWDKEHTVLRQGVTLTLGQDLQGFGVGHTKQGKRNMEMRHGTGSWTGVGKGETQREQDKLG